MAKEYIFSVCLYIDSDSNLERSIEGIIGKEDFFKGNMQLLLLDKLCSAYTIGLCEKYTSAYPENIFFIECRGESRVKAYNNARPLASGRFIAFTDNLGVYSPNAFETVVKNVDLNLPLMTFNPVTFSPVRGEEYYLPKYDEGIIRLDETPDRFHFMLGAYLFSHSLIDGLYFDDMLQFHSEECFIIEAARLSRCYAFVRSSNYTTARSYEYDFNGYPPQYSRAFYSDAIRSFIQPYLQDHKDSPFVQSAMFYLLAVKFSLNMDDRCKCTLSSSEVTEFFQVCTEAMKYIADPVILNPELYRRSRLTQETSFRLLRLKYHNKYLKPEMKYYSSGEYTYTGRNLKQKKINVHEEWIASISDALVGRSSELDVKIMAMNYDMGGLILDGVLEGASCFEPDDIEVLAALNKKRLKIKRTSVYSLTKFFGVPFLNLYTFRLYVPLSDGKNMDVLSFYLKFSGKVFRPALRFGNEGARLSTEVKSSYWVFADKLIYFDTRVRALIIRKATDSLIHRRESKFLSELAKQVSFKEYWYYRKLRSLFRKSARNAEENVIWMFYEESGINRNGNLLFRFVRKFRQSSGIAAYFSVREDSAEEAFLTEKYGNTLQIGTERQKLMTMLSDVLIATDCDVYEALGFNAKDRIYLRDLFRANIVSVKNFFMTAQTAQFDNRLRDNISLVCCCSEKEKKQLLHPVYGYNENMVKVVGYPVFDALHFAPEKRILIYPAEHREFMMYENISEHSFEDTAFFKVYNSLITDTSLLDCAKAKGFKITLLLPPSLEKFVKHFSSNECVEIAAFSPQEEYHLIVHSAVLLTDFSEAHYLFAYMNRPTVYYMPPAISIPEEFRRMNLTETGFGSVAFVHKDAVRMLNDCMLRGDLTLKGNFRTRRDYFFDCVESKCCEQIFEELKEYQKYLYALKHCTIGAVKSKTEESAKSDTETQSKTVIGIDTSKLNIQPKEAILQNSTTQTENIIAGDLNRPAVPIRSAEVFDSEKKEASEAVTKEKVEKSEKIVLLEQIDPKSLQNRVVPIKNSETKNEDTKSEESDIFLN